MPPATTKDVSSKVVNLKNASNSVREKPKAGAGRKESAATPAEPAKTDKLQGKSAGKRKEEKPVKNAKKKKKKGESDQPKAFRPKKTKQNFMVKFFTPQRDVVLRDPRAIEAADALHLTQRHLRKLRAKFDEIDIDGSGNIDVEEFFEYCGESRSPITDRLFNLIDLDGSGTIEFEEYVRIMATYCMYTKDEILRFCFETFDKDGSNAIDEKEFMELCK
jgi:Ca2+-binding EF-hand superfamily protein